MKNRMTAVLLTVALATALLAGCAKKPVERIGIISAMDNEIAILLKEAKIDRTETFGGTEYHVGTLRGMPVVITRAGIGKVLAASCVTTLLERYDISKVIFTGIAGGVADCTEVMDEVVATNLVEHDYGFLTNDGFVWCSGDPGMGGEEGIYYPCDPELVTLAYEAAVEVVGEDHAYKGTIATGDQFIASQDYVARLQKDYDAYACEMEGAAIAAVCGKYEKPFVVIRALSDKADGNAHESYENFGDIAADHSSAILLKMLEGMGK